MLFSTLQIAALLSGLTAAQSVMRQATDGPWGVSLSPKNHLSSRQTETCQGTCATCFGAGNIICEGIMCYNPSAGEQCCAGGQYCIGPDTSCCGSAGAGTSFDDSASVTEDSSTPTATEDVSTTSETSSSSSSPDEWTCLRSDSDEECCQRAGSGTHWCYTTLEAVICYDADQGEECCADGTGCETPGCCAAGVSQTTIMCTGIGINQNCRVPLLLRPFLHLDSPMSPAPPSSCRLALSTSVTRPLSFVAPQTSPRRS
ncbi:hypothetical protein K402DRAFT_175529 [Aulographum hederae CBS 113979]|uniref:Uncharacterized protein n=1 Tax=Aulographum hederae CBS 113979 TaxID=1176131 RepID=A0A6G1GR66_9PEZI|nr:hypothetical protein K402DRAFT_175529 [Aulographum hederae CBS 113979]